MQADKSVLVATSDDSYDSAGSSPTTACIPECECPSKAPFPGTFDLPLAGEVPHDPLDASSSPARHYQQSSDHGMADTPQRQLHPEGETLLDEEGKPATPMRQTLNKLARQELSRLSFDFPADPASRRSQRWADDPSLGTFDKRPWSDDLCINGGPSRGPGSRRDSPALHHHTLSLDGSLDSFNSIFASSTAQMEVQERGVKILPIADLKALNTSLLKKYSPSAAPSSDVLLPPTCQSVEEAGGPCATFAASMSLRVGSATQSERQKQETYQTRLHQRSQSLSLPRGRGLVGRCLTAPMSEPLQVPVSMSSQGRGGFGFEDAGGMPSPLVVAPSSCGSGSSLACPLRHQRHQSMIVPGRNSQLCGDSSLPGGQCVPRPPLYHNLASGNPGGLLTGPSSNKGGGIWAMTESDRRRRSSSGSSTWEDNLGSNTPDGVSDPPKGPGDARSAGDCDEFSVPDGGQAGEEGVRDEDSSTAATWSALQPGSSAEHMFKANNPVFEDGEVAAGGVQAQRYYCNLCGINATSEAHLEAHYSGRRHQKNLANMYRGAPPPSETTRYHCPLCNVGATSEAHLEAHFRGKQHLRKLAAATGTSAVLPTYRCTLCGVTATSGDHLLSHFRGKQHQRKMQLAEQPPRNAQTPSEPFPPAPVPSWRQGRQQPLDGSRVMVPTIAPFSPVHIQPIMSSETWPMAGYIPPPPPPPPPSHHSWRRQDGVYAPHPFGGLRVPLRQWQGHQIPQRWER